MNLAITQVDQLINRLLDETNADTFHLYLTGSENFRYSVNPEYKANRLDTPRPRHLEPLREHCIVSYGATLSQGCEADDLLGIAQCSSEQDTVVVSLDKDLLMIPGKHYSWEISGKTKTGSWTKPAIWRETSEIDGLRYFYGQLLLGDKSDNVFGFDGLARAKVPQKMQWMFDRLEELDTELDMFEFVSSLYEDFNDMGAMERLVMNGRCLWIWRKPEDIWEPPLA